MASNQLEEQQANSECYNCGTETKPFEDKMMCPNCFCYTTRTDLQPSDPAETTEVANAPSHPSKTITIESLSTTISEILNNEDNWLHGKTFPPANVMINEDKVTSQLLAVFQKHLDQKVTEIEQVHLNNYAWLLGLSGDFPLSELGKRYGFRTHLRTRIPDHMLKELSNISKGGLDED